MFETRFVVQPTKHALDSSTLQRNYFECWQGLKRGFTPPGRS
jgi:homogentisate 1,2-dioxygenase